MLKMNGSFKPATVLTAALIALASYANFVVAEDLLSAEEREQALINAMPELQQDGKTSGSETRSGGSTMSCFVDTPAYDEFTTGSCFSVDLAFTTSALFRIDNPPSNFTIQWSDSRCDSSSIYCSLPIRHYQTITLDAAVLDNSNNTFENVSATARYEAFF